MTTFQKVITLSWCLLPLELAFLWVDESRQRAPWGTWRRAVAARRQLRLVPGAGAAYLAGFVAALGLVGRLQRLDQAQQILGVVCCALLLLSAWRDAQRMVDAWRDSGHGGWWRRARRPHRAPAYARNIARSRRVVNVTPSAIMTTK